MSKEILTQITIAAKPDDVWAVLSDFAAHADWNPFIRQIEGRCETGAPLRVTLCQPSGKLYVFKATLTACEPGRLLQWRGALAGMHWLFSGLHGFELRPAPDGATVLVHKESFAGLLAAPVLASIRNDTRRSFEAMNLALRDHVEAALALCEGPCHG